MEKFKDLEKILRLSGKLVYFLTSDSSQKYETYYIPKKDNTQREINAPILALKIVQKWILNNILYKIKVSPYSYGFYKDGLGSPLVRCAKKHKENLFILKIDIKDFFPSISRKRIYRLFSDIGYNSEVSNLLTNICVYDDKLPQGAVTSPYLANLVCKNLDTRIATYCNKRDIVYTRYADDLTFSSDNRDLLKNIYGVICKILRTEGFDINNKKTIFMTPKNHKKILGITVNNSLIKAPKDLKRKVRSMIHISMATGNYTLNLQIIGYISYINSIETDYTERIKKYILKLSESPLCTIKELVDAYNDNKIFNDLPNMVLKDAESFVDAQNAETFYKEVYTEYLNFMTSHKGTISLT